MATIVVTNAKKARAPSKPKSVDDWQARNDLSTLQEAERIKADKARLSAAKRQAEAGLQAVEDARKKNG